MLYLLKSKEKRFCGENVELISPFRFLAKKEKRENSILVMALNLINVHLSMILKWVAVVTLPTNGKLFFLPCEKWFFCSPSDGYWIFPRLLCSVVKKNEEEYLLWEERRK